MLGVAMWTTIKTLKEQGKNKAQISKITGHDWKTVDKVVRKLESGENSPQSKTRKNILSSYKEYILELLEKGLSGVRIHEELINKGFNGSYETVKYHIRNIRRKEKIFVRIHTEPGEEAQVDFGYVGRIPDNNGKLRKTWVFNMRLSYSRLDYYEKVYNQKVETFIQCHINAFESFEGVPDSVRIDNLKAAILEANFYEPIYQKVYQDFANYYGFKSIPCRIYKPNDKGKVESGIKYVKNNFFKGRDFSGGNDCDNQLRQWNRKANLRIHGTTRKVPQELFEQEEKILLHRLPEKPFLIAKPGRRKVYHDCHIYVDYNYYSVPFEYCGKEVEFELTKELLRLYYKGKALATHQRLEGKGKFNTVMSHYPKYKVYSETDYQEKYQTKMAKIGSYAEQLFFAMKENNNYWIRASQGILSLTKKYSKNVVNLACQRALAYQAYYYRVVKSICEKGTYNLPVEFNNN
jgi:transposase